MNILAYLIFLTSAVSNISADAVAANGFISLPERGTEYAQKALIGAHLKDYPCPEAADIVPCTCMVDVDRNLNMDCSAITSNEELNAVFLSDIPVPDFHEFKILDNDYFTQLQPNCFANVTFEKINIQHTNIDFVSPAALSTSASKLWYIDIDNGLLTESTFPFESIHQYTNLEYLYVDHQWDMVTVPALASSTLALLRFDGCSLASLSPGNSVISIR